MGNTRKKFIIQLLASTTRLGEATILEKMSEEFYDNFIEEVLEDGDPSEKYLVLLEILSPGTCEAILNRRNENG